MTAHEVAAPMMAVQRWYTGPARQPVVARAEEVGAGVGVAQSGATEHAEAPRDARYRLRAGLAVVGAEKIASLRPT